jgi:thioredoxin reductase (NADPH)
LEYSVCVFNLIMNMKKEKLIIIGSGPAGLTAALYAARAELKPVVFEGKEPGGQLMGTTDIENFPGVADGTTGPSLMVRMREQAQKFGTETKFETIEKVDFSDPLDLKLWSNEHEYHAECVIIATGAAARWLNLGKGEEKYKGKGYTACATCDGAFFRDKVVAVVGGGDSACEEATFLTKFAKKVYLIHRRDTLNASKPMQQRVFDNANVEILWNKNVTDLRGDPVLQKVELTDSVDGSTSELELDGLFMAIGRIPNTKFLEGHLDIGRGGYLEVIENTKSKIPSVFIAGDCSDPHYQQAIMAAGMGCAASLDAEHYLTTK